MRWPQRDSLNLFKKHRVFEELSSWPGTMLLYTWFMVCIIIRFLSLVARHSHENNLLFQALSLLIMAWKRPWKNPRSSMSLKVGMIMMMLLRVSQGIVGRVSQMPMTHSIFPHLFAKIRLALLICPTNCFFCLAPIGEIFRYVKRGYGLQNPWL